MIGSVLGGLGRSIVVMFPRQSGKNELQAQIEAYLLYLFNRQPADLIKVSPTWRPQSLNAMRRLERVLGANRLTLGQACKENGCIYRLGEARITFLSAAPEANIVGATASALLEVDEAQDVRIDKYDREIAPMAASTNATRVFWGTAWTSETLLARELRAAQAAERADGGRRVFRLTADEVAAEVPAYGRYVAGEVARLGRSHPSIRTQYFSEEIDAGGGLFGPERVLAMQGMHAWQAGPQAGELYALLLDVGGEEVSTAGQSGRQHDSTALTVILVDRSTLADPALHAPIYRVVHLRTWTGVSQPDLYAQVLALAQTWQARRLVIDASGLGAGLAAFLERGLPGRVVRYTFNPASKSRLGWSFINLVEAGRFKLPRTPGSGEAERVDLLRAQCRACTFEIYGGPARLLRWSVPDAARHPQTGALLHDDLLLSAALCAVLDETTWPEPVSDAGIIRAKDPLQEKAGF